MTLLLICFAVVVVLIFALVLDDIRIRVKRIENTLLAFIEDVEGE